MTQRIFSSVAVAAAIGVAVVLGWRLAPAEEPPHVPRERPEPGVLRFAPGAPQLAMLRIEALPELPVPLAEPLNGRVVYGESYTARVTSPVAGRIVELRAQIGDRVAAGAPLAVIDAPDFGAAVADLEKARADERRKQLALARVRELFDAEVAPRKDLESAQADLDQAKAETARAALRVRNLQPHGGRVEGQRMTLSSPVSGVVAERKANPAMEVRPDLPDPLFVVTDLRHVQIVIDLPERYLDKAAVRQPVAVEVDAYPGRRFAGRIERIAPAVDPATRRIQVRCNVDNAESRLRPEMYARVTLLADVHRTAIRVPNGALVAQGLQNFVFVEREPGVLVRRPVTLAIQDREYSYVAAGLAKGERVVTSGALLLQSELAAEQ